MELRKRQAKILQDLFEKKRISVDAILNEYGISKRTLYYDLNKINDWLSEDNFGMASIEDKEIVIEITNLAGIEKQMHKGKEYYFSSEERRAIEFLFITLNSEKINRHSPYLSITLHKCYPYYLFGISAFPNSAYHTTARRKFSITIV